jgi:hypothetical protein
MHEGMEISNRSRRAKLIAAHVALGLIFFGALALLFGYFVMLLWNSVVADAPGVGKLNYWQGVGLLVLCRVLVGGFHAGHGAHGRHKTAAGSKRDLALDDFVEDGKRTTDD